MLACLPVTGDLSLRLLSHTQMNTGLQKWDTTQKMRSAQYPTPAELDAYAKKVANSPLTIKIFPNSVKVPQRKHVRRTVNGLDTSSQRYSPYPAPASARAGLLAVVKGPLKGILKGFEGGRARLLSEVAMNPPAGPYGSQSTLNLPQTVPHPQGLPRGRALPPQQGLGHPQSLQQQQQGLSHPQSLQQQQQQQQQQQACPTLQQPAPQGPRHLPGMAQHPQAAAQAQSLQHPAGLGPLPPGVLHGPRKLADGDAPPNVTVSTSTIPLSMAAGRQQGRRADLSSIVLQISQFCQPRAGASATSVCEGQIANPSPINRNLLINASSRVSAQHPGPLPPCALGPADKPPAAASRMPVYHPDVKQQRGWTQHHLAHLQQHLSEEGHPCARLPVSFPPQDPCAGQPYSLKPPAEKPTPSPPVNGMPPGVVPYGNGHYFQPVWNGVLPTPNSDGSGSQDLAMPFHGGPPGTVDCGPGPQYRAGAGSSGQTNVMQSMEYMGGEYQPPCFRDQSLGMHRPPMGRAPEPGDARNTHIQVPGYR
ncbi:hypothetical protein COCON_G00192010 [Conger conger]|uniref:Protein FAM222B n=1 Tax=Conger conger TaxID=82655 RepID=A0A9Q1D3Z2_CONCO|nr:hypothetical protein COCON_G00192010 [Conger conger]